MRREERVTVQGPVKEQQPDGMSHRGGVAWTPAEGGEGVPEMGFRGGPSVLCKDGCCRQRHRNTKFYCLWQVHLAQNLPQATHTQNKEKKLHKYGLKHALHILDGRFR